MRSISHDPNISICDDQWRKELDWMRLVSEVKTISGRYLGYTSAWGRVERAGTGAPRARSASSLMRRGNARTATSTTEQRRRLELLKRTGRLR
jgi:hypothetical protein